MISTYRYGFSIIYPGDKSKREDHVSTTQFPPMMTNQNGHIFYEYVFIIYGKSCNHYRIHTGNCSIHLRAICFCFALSATSLPPCLNSFPITSVLFFILFCFFVVVFVDVVAAVCVCFIQGRGCMGKG